MIKNNLVVGSGEIADRVAARYSPYVAVLHREGKQCLGGAYGAGFRYALSRGYRQVTEALRIVWSLRFSPPSSVVHGARP
jgi:dolichol-phosphate mannosyltransferase